MVRSEFGWRSVEDEGDESSYLIFTKDDKNVYNADWDDDSYEVYSDRNWLTFYYPEQFQSGNYEMGECYSISFRGKDTYEICYVHMYAVIYNEYWITYVRNDSSSGDELISSNKSKNPEDIEIFLNKINGKYIECTYDENIFRQTCKQFIITKKKNKKAGHQNF